MEDPRQQLSRRERQIMDVLFRRGEASAAEVQEDIPDAPSYSAVRALLRIMEDKGHITHEQDGPRYMYRPTIGKDRARRSALDHVMTTFFNNSAVQVMAALLDSDASEVGEDELDRLTSLIERARNKES